MRTARRKPSWNADRVSIASSAWPAHARHEPAANRGAVILQRAPRVLAMRQPSRCCQLLWSHMGTAAAPSVMLSLLRMEAVTNAHRGLDLGRLTPT